YPVGIWSVRPDPLFTLEGSAFDLTQREADIAAVKDDLVAGPDIAQSVAVLGRHPPDAVLHGDLEIVLTSLPDCHPVHGIVRGDDRADDPAAATCTDHLTEQNR